MDCPKTVDIARTGRFWEKIKFFFFLEIYTVQGLSKNSQQYEQLLFSKNVHIH